MMRNESRGSARPPDHLSASNDDSPRPLAFELLALSKVYQRSKGMLVRAVDNFTLFLPAGQVLGLLGPNGAGKTTTIKMLCGLVTPTSGRVMLGGVDVARERSLAVQQIGAVLEGARNVYWSLSAWQNLLYFGRLKELLQVLMFLFGGVFVPLDHLPQWMAIIARFLPITPGIAGLQQTLLTGNSPGTLVGNGTLWWLIGDALAYLGPGIIVLSGCERMAKRLGTLGQY